MDIKQKLEFYKSVNKPSQQIPDENITPSLMALSDHFKAQVIHPAAPYLEITRRQPLQFNLNSSIKIKLLSKNELSDPIEINDILFFDLETTGLAGGAGTFAFLLGFGWIEEGEIVVKQYFLPDFGREFKLFEKLNQLFSGFKYLVSYNGKSYDLPLLRNRFLLNRHHFNLDQLTHIDLLHISRRIWKDSFTSCDLKTLEYALLSVERQGDIPGAFIPQAYFDFIRTGVIHDVIRIITHNYIDITSLAGLLLYMDQIEQNPQNLKNTAAKLRLARLAFELDDIKFIESMTEFFQNDPLDLFQLKKWQSLLYKRRQRWPDAIEIWEKLANSNKHQIFALEELAKFYEHIDADLDKALYYSKRAITILNTLEEFGADHHILYYKDAFNHRYHRLIQKTA